MTSYCFLFNKNLNQNSCLVKHIPFKVGFFASNVIWGFFGSSISWQHGPTRLTDLPISHPLSWKWGINYFSGGVGPGKKPGASAAPGFNHSSAPATQQPGKRRTMAD